MCTTSENAAASSSSPDRAVLSAGSALPAGGDHLPLSSRHETRASGRIRHLLDRAGELLAGQGPRFAGFAERLARLGARLETGAFHLAVIGQFKRGKSSLVNALLGEEILPTAMVPLTSIPTFLVFGPEVRVRVHFLDEKQPVRTLDAAGTVAEALAEYVTESRNPENRLGVDHVEIRHPAPILDSGLILIDTPGIGSTFRHNTRTTFDFLAECDAALFVLSPDPPVTEAEIEFLQHVRAHVARLFFVLNKCDLFPPADVETARVFLEKVLREQAGFPADAIEILEVSARTGLAALRDGDEAALEASGLAAMRRRLTNFARSEKLEAAVAAVRRKSLQVLEEARLQAQVHSRSLQMPITELQEKESRLEHILSEATTLTFVLEDRLKGERGRIIQQVEVYCGQVRERVTEELGAMIRAACGDKRRRSSLERVRREIAGAVPGVFSREFRNALDWFRSLTEESLRPYIEEVRALIANVSREASDLFDLPVDVREPALELELPGEPFWTTEKWSATINPLSLVRFDFLLPGFWRRRRNERRLREEVREIITMDIEKLRWALLQTLNDTAVRFLSEVRARLGTTRSTILESMTAARAMREQTAGDVSEEIARLKRFCRRIDGLVGETRASV